MNLIDRLKGKKDTKDKYTTVINVTVNKDGFYQVETDSGIFTMKTPVEINDLIIINESSRYAWPAGLDKTVDDS